MSMFFAIRMGKGARRIVMVAAGIMLPLAALLLVVPSARGQAHFTSCAANTGNNAIVVIPIGSVQAGSFTPETGDEIAAFRPADPLCAGSVVNDSTINNSVTVWGNNSITDPVIDGMLSGEEMQWRIWDASEDIEYYATVTYDATVLFDGTGIYVANGLFQLLTFAPNGTTAVALSSLGSTESPLAMIPLLAMMGLGVITIVLLRARGHSMRRPGD